MEHTKTTFKHPGDLDSEIWEWLKEHGTEETKQVIMMTARHFARFTVARKQEQPSLPTIKGWIARDDADRLGLYDQKPTRKTELGDFSGIVHSWVIGDTWIGRFSLDKTAKPLFPNLCWADDPIEVELIIKPIQEQPEVHTKMRTCDKLEMEKLYGEEY